MNLSAVATFPRPYSERAHAFRAAVGYAPAAMTRSGSVRLVDLKKRCLPSGRLVPQHFLEHVPARIQDGLSHLGLDEFGAAHVTDDDQFIFKGNPGGCDVQMVFARVGDLGMDRSNALFVSGPLRLTQGVCVFPVMLESGNARAVATGGHSLEAEVDADFPGASLLRFNLTLENDVPTTASVLGEAASFYGAGHLTVLPKTNLSLRIHKKAASDWEVSPPKRNPPKGSFSSIAGPKTWAASAFASRLDKRPADFANSIRRYSKFSSRSRGEVHQVKMSWPARQPSGPPSRLCLPLDFTAVVPNDVTGPRISIQTLCSAPVFHSVFEG